MNKITKDGKNYYTYPNLPYDIGETLRRITNFYLRTNPATGELVITEWSITPNNCTPRKLGPLLDMLQDITDLNTARLIDEPSAARPQMLKDQSKWQARLLFYKEVVADLMNESPDQTSEDLHRLVVMPLFWGWYPNELEPFASQVGPFSAQSGSAVMDLIMPFTLANQLHVAREAQIDAYEKFKEDLKQRTTMIFTEYLPILPLLTILPYAIAGAVGLAVYSRLKKD